MFSFFKSKTVETPHLKVDLHSHLIPSIDDGSQDMKESLILLKGLSELGYEKVITTPHIMADCYRNDKKIILDGLHDLQGKAKEAGINTTIEAAAEYYLDDGFYDHLNESEMLTIGDNYILCETSYISKPLHFEEMIFEILTKGYKPILAHPERYRYVQNFEEEYRKMKALGIFFQVNINSFGGHYGKDAQKKAMFLSRKGMIDFLGSDIHSIKQVETLKGVKDSKIYVNIFTNNTILNNTL